MHINFAAGRLAFAICLLALAGFSDAHTFDEEEFLGKKVQVKMEPYYMNGNLIGIDIYELFPDSEIGHSVIAKRSYYRFDTERATEDRDWYRVTGFLSENVLEIEQSYESQHWNITPDLAAKLDHAAKVIADPKSSIEDLRKIYRVFRVSPFSVQAGPIDRKGESRLKWLAGPQLIGVAEFNLARAPKYGNRFAAKLNN